MASARFFSPSVLSPCGCLFFKYLHVHVTYNIRARTTGYIYIYIFFLPFIYFSSFFFFIFVFFLSFFNPFYLRVFFSPPPGPPLTLSTKFQQGQAHTAIHHPTHPGAAASRVKSFIVHVRKSDWALSEFLSPCAPLFPAILSPFLRPLSTPGVSVSPRGFFVRANA